MSWRVVGRLLRLKHYAVPAACAPCRLLTHPRTLPKSASSPPPTEPSMRAPPATPASRSACQSSPRKSSQYVRSQPMPLVPQICPTWPHSNLLFGWLLVPETAGTASPHQPLPRPLMLPPSRVPPPRSNSRLPPPQRIPRPAESLPVQQQGPLQPLPPQPPVLRFLSQRSVELRPPQPVLPQPPLWH